MISEHRQLRRRNTWAHPVSFLLLLITAGVTVVVGRFAVLFVCLVLVVGTAVDTFLYYIVCQEVPVESEAGDDDSPPPSPGRQSAHSLSSFLPQPLFLYPILGYTDLVKLA